MCYATRTIWTICGHHQDTHPSSSYCLRANTRRRAGITFHRLKPPCAATSDQRAYLKVGFCPRCVDYFESQADPVYETDANFIVNFWAWRSWHGNGGVNLGGVPEPKHAPLDGLLPDYRPSDYNMLPGDISERFRRHAHGVLIQPPGHLTYSFFFSAASWPERNARSLFPNASNGVNAIVPSIHSLRPEDWVIWWKLYQFQPIAIIPDEQLRDVGAKKANTLQEAQELMGDVRRFTLLSFAKKDTLRELGPSILH